MKEEAKKKWTTEGKSIYSQTTSYCYLSLFFNSDDVAAFLNRNSSSSVQDSG